MSVKELNSEQLDCLRVDLFYNPENPDLVADYSGFWEIPESLLFRVYDGINFVDDDFAN